MDALSPQLDDEAFVLVDELPHTIHDWFPSDRHVWNAAVCAKARDRRDALAGRLFLDDVLALADVDGSQLYPPTSPAALTSLLDAVLASSFDSLKRNAVVYYLLLDITPPKRVQPRRPPLSPDMEDLGDLLEPSARSASTDKKSRAAAFAIQTLLVPQFKRVMEGYWLLDHGYYKAAIPCLRTLDPAIAPKAICALFPPSHLPGSPFPCSHPNVTTTLSIAESSALLLSLLRGASPPPTLTDPFLLEARVLATAHVSGAQNAWDLVCQAEGQESGSPLRDALADRFFAFCVSPPTKASLHTLLSLPFAPRQEAHFTTFCLRPPAYLSALGVAIATDLLLVRHITAGRYLEAVRISGRLDAMGAGMRVVEAVAARDSSLPEHREKIAALREKRRAMIEGARAVLPDVQKDLLRAEMARDAVEASGESEAVQEERAAAYGADAQSQNPESGLQMSWESLPGDTESGLSTTPRRTPMGPPMSPLSASISRPAGSPAGQTVDPQDALLHAILRASTNRPATSTTLGSPARKEQAPVHSSADSNKSFESASPQAMQQAQQSQIPRIPAFLRARASQGGSGSNASLNTPEKGSPSNVLGVSPGLRSGPSTPNWLNRVGGADFSNGGQSASPFTPSKSSASPSANLSMPLASLSPFAGPPRLSASPATRQSVDSPAPAQPSPFQAPVRRYQAAYREARASPATLYSARDAPSLIEGDVDMHFDGHEEDNAGDVSYGASQEMLASSPAPRANRRQRLPPRRSRLSQSHSRLDLAEGEEQEEPEAAAEGSRQRAEDLRASVPGGFPGFDDAEEAERGGQSAGKEAQKSASSRSKSRGTAPAKRSTRQTSAAPAPPADTTAPSRRSRRRPAASSRRDDEEEDDDAAPSEATADDEEESTQRRRTRRAAPAVKPSRTRRLRSVTAEEARGEEDEEETQQTSAPRRRTAARSSRAPPKAAANEEILPGVRTRSGKRTMPGGLE